MKNKKEVGGGALSLREIKQAGGRDEFKSSIYNAGVEAGANRAIEKLIPWVKSVDSQLESIQSTKNINHTEIIETRYSHKTDSLN